MNAYPRHFLEGVIVVTATATWGLAQGAENYAGPLTDDAADRSLVGCVSTGEIGQSDAFNYQGRLLVDGEPAEGEYDMRFELHAFADSNGGEGCDDPLGDTLEFDSVPVSEGLFTLELDFGPVFPAARRYMEVAVRPGAASGADPYTVFPQRQHLLATPYAHGLHLPWDAAITVADAALHIKQTWHTADAVVARFEIDNAVSVADALIGVTNGSGAAVRGESFASSNPGGAPLAGVLGIGHLDAGVRGEGAFRGVYGLGTGPAGFQTDGVWGETASSGGAGVRARNTSTTGVSAGLFASTASTTGRAVYSQASSPTGANFGGWFSSSSSAGTGVFGWGTASSGLNFGLYGETDSTQGIGVYGFADASTGVTYGVRGKCDSPDGFAGHFDGRGYFSGNVGIGTESPAANLHVVGGENTGTTSALRIETILTQYMLIDSNEIDAFGNVDLSLNSNSPNDIALAMGGGQVGLGTNEPDADLHVVGTDILLSPTHLLNEDVLVEDSDAVLGLYSSPGGTFGSAVTLAEIDATGLVDKWAIARQTSGSNSDLVFTYGSDPAYNVNPAQMVLTTSGNLGLGQSAPTFRLQLPNNANSTGQGRANAWTTYSSRRWKENIQPIDGALDKVCRMQGVTFDWLPAYGGTHDVGFIAEEAGAVLPELVAWEEDGVSAAGLKYDRVSALTVEAIKEQQRQIESLRDENDALTARLEAIEKYIAQTNR